MSQWTHVAGIVRVDGMDFPGKNIGKNLLKRLGDMVPTGSEGPIQYKLDRDIEAVYSLCWGIVYIWGDLRDYENVDEIFRWVKNAFESKPEDGFFVRQLSVKIDVEYKGNYLVYDKEGEGWPEIALTKLE